VYSARPFVELLKATRLPLGRVVAVSAPAERWSHSIAFALNVGDWPPKVFAGLARVGFGCPP
jgi:hypothetical protein